MPGSLILQTSSQGVTLLSSPLLTAAGVPHAFTTRIGGVSRGPFESLNLGNPSDVSIQDTRENIAENYRRVMDSLGILDRNRHWSHQVHGAECRRVDEITGFENATRCDALVTADPESSVSVRVADCVPILIASADGSRVAAVHAGWRGVILGVVPNTVSMLLSPANPKSSELAPENLVAAIGPHISAAAFEVGEEVAREFAIQFPDSQIVRRDLGEKPHVDLQSAILRQLESCGLSSKQMDACDLCTFGRPDLFFSHRRDRGVTGRMCAIISPRRPA